MKFIIDFKNDTPKTNIDSYLETNSCTIVKVYDNFQAVYLVESELEPSVAEIVETVIADDVETIIPLSLPLAQYFGVDNPAHRTSTITVNDPVQWWKIYSHDNIDFNNQSITFTRKGSMVDVYMVDSGIMANHPEFTNSNIVNLFSFNNDFNDYNGHGTALSSLIVGDTCGITDAKLKVVKIFQEGTPTRYSDLIAAFDSIINDKRLNLDRPAVANLSWSITKNTYIEDKIQTLLSYNVYVVAAAGNSGLPISNVTPASMSQVVTVGSYNADFDPCDFSSYQPVAPELATSQNEVNMGELDGWAPGINIRTAVINGQYADQSGTSFSAALTSAVLAYNLDDFVQDVSGAGWNDLPQQILVEKVFFRHSLLNLDSNKYAPTSNRILTWVLNTSMQFQPVMPYIERQVVAEHGLGIKLFHVPSVNSTVLLTPLPDYITWSSMGYIIVNPTELDQSYTVETLKFNTTDINDTQIEQTVKLIIFRSNIEGTSVFIPDQEVPITLLLSQNCSNWNFNYGGAYGCFSPVVYDGCNDNCTPVYGSGYFCFIALCPTNKNQDACTCWNGSDISLKTNIEFKEKKLDVNFYEFNYIWDKTTKHIGVMAQELLGTIYESCVKKAFSGHYLVNYKLLYKMLNDGLDKKDI